MSFTINYGGKLFVADGGQIVLGKIIGGLLYMENQWNYLFLRLIVKIFHRLYHG